MPAPRKPISAPITRAPITFAQLKEYCATHEIFVPPRADRSAYEAAIARAAHHGGMTSPDPEIGCFGYFVADEPTCCMCRYKGDCADAALGMPKAQYDSAMNRVPNPRLSFRVLKKKTK